MNPFQNETFQKMKDMGVVFAIIILSYSLLYGLKWIAEKKIFSKINIENFTSIKEFDFFGFGIMIVLYLVFYASVFFSTIFSKSKYRIDIKIIGEKDTVLKHSTDAAFVGIILGFLSIGFSLKVLGGLPEFWKMTGTSKTVYLFTPFLHLFLVLIGSAVEEFFFRGFCYTLFKNTYGIVKSIFITSTIFTFWHVYHIINEPYLLIMNFIGGIVLCYVFEKSKCLLPAIICHISVNTVVLFASYIL